MTPDFQRWFRPSSLRRRLLLISLAVLPLLLGIAGIALDQSHERSLRAAQQERMKAQLYLVLAAVEFRDGRLQMPAHLAEPRYDQLSSGLYAAITSPDGALMWYSPSAAAIDWPRPNVDAQPFGDIAYEQWRIGGRWAHETRLKVVWEYGGGEIPFVIRVVEDATPWLAERNSYRTSLWMSLFALALAWLGLLWLVIRVGLRPLDRLTETLVELESGRRDQLPGDFPDEVSQLARRLNQLVRAERQQRERYRTTLADLAHSLKTPLSVMRGVMAREQPLSEGDRREVEQQVLRMNQIVDYQLQRAVRSADQKLLKPVDLAQLLVRLVNTLGKVYPERPIQAEGLTEPVWVPGDEGDLMELFGNLLENACKYSRAAVQLTLSADEHQVMVKIADDGPGISPMAWQKLQKRGVRADQLVPGQGIGLSVAADILVSFGGQWQLGKAALGGAEITVTLPLRPPSQPAQ